jgi:hypothetical protein
MLDASKLLHLLDHQRIQIDHYLRFDHYSIEIQEHFFRNALALDYLEQMHIYSDFLS